MRCFLFCLLFSFSVTAQEKWPARFQMLPPEMVPLPERQNLVAWETKHFFLVCEGKVPEVQIREFAQVMESVPSLLQSLPIALWAPPKGSKPVVRICRDEASFVAAGGPVGAAGYYHGRQAKVLVRGDILFAPPQPGAPQLPQSPDGDLLVHELCHLAMHQHRSLPTWLTEGIAEYFASCHLGRGSYDFSHSQRLIPQHIQKFYPKELYPLLPLGSLSDIVARKSRDWERYNKRVLPAERYLPYATSLLLAHYYLEGSDQRKEELASYLQKSLSSEDQKIRPLLATIPEGLESRLANYWKTRGLHIQFAAP